MQIVELNMFEFDDYAKTHPLKNYYQTSNYAMLMAENGYSYEFIGYKDEFNRIHAASLILYKKIKFHYKYGYSPKGFLIDYSDKILVNNFTQKLKEYYQNKSISFIKINPEIAIGVVDQNSFQTIHNNNVPLINNLTENGYVKLKDNKYFESLVPKYNAILPLRSFDIKKINKNTRNKINKSLRKGLILEEAGVDKIGIFYSFIKNKVTRKEEYYQDYYNIFNKNHSIDLFLVKIDYKKYLMESQKLYEKESYRNSVYNNLIQTEASKTNINKKMESDKILNMYNNEIIDATNGLKNNPDGIYIAGGLTVKYDNRVNIVITGYDKRFSGFCPNYFLHYKLIEHYQKNYIIMDLNGISGDFAKNSKYYGLNRFKMGFNPKIYEFVGELDLLIDEADYKYLENTNALAKEFNKPQED